MDKSLLRHSNFELLKVIAILMVILLHYFNPSMGGAVKNVPPGTFNYYAMYFLESISIIAVNCFVLVSGYFMVEKNHIKLRKVINLLTITIFYGVLSYLIHAIFKIYIGEDWFSFRGLASAIVPLHGAKWFVGSYVVLFLLSPFINMALNQLSKKQFKQLLVIMVICFSITPTCLPIVSYNDGGYGVLSFILLYCIGAYLKRYRVDTKSKWMYLGIYLFSTTITCGLSLKFGAPHFVWWYYNTIFNIVSAVSLFLFFSKFKIHSKKINFLATFTFAVYIIHTDSALTDIIFEKILRCNQYWDSQWFLLHLLVSVIFIFAGCVVIETARRYIFTLISRKFRIQKLNKVTIG